MNKNKILLGIAIIIFGSFAFMLLYRLGIHPIIDFDESIYAEVARQALRGHHWLRLNYYGHDWFEKPPLVIWLMAGMYAIGGTNEWMTRLPGTVAAIVTVALSLRWVYELRRSYVDVIFTGACYFVMFPFITTPYFANFDSILGLFILVSLYSWWKASRTGDNHWYWVWGASLGLGVMTKNIVGLFPLVPILIYTVIERKFEFLKNKYFWYSVILAAVIILPWHIYMSIVAGKAFWNNYLFYHVFQRYSSSLEGNGAPFWYYLSFVFWRYKLALLVFGGSALAAIVWSWKNSAIRYITIAALALILIFSSSTTKLPAYIMVALPLFVMLAGICFGRLMDFVPRAWLKVLAAAIVVLALMWNGYQFNNYKLAQGEYSEEYLSNQKVGQFLKDYKRELPVYINYPLRNGEIGYYADRPVEPVTDKLFTINAIQRVMHTNFESVYLGNGYIIIVR